MVNSSASGVAQLAFVIVQGQTMAAVRLLMSERTDQEAVCTFCGGSSWA